MLNDGVKPSYFKKEPLQPLTLQYILVMNNILSDDAIEFAEFSSAAAELFLILSCQLNPSWEPSLTVFHWTSSKV